MIDELLRRLDDPLATIAYPTKPTNHSDTGHVVYGLDPSINAAMADREIVGPVQVVRRPGLGDKVFAIAACSAFVKQHPDIELTFAGLDTDTWLKQIPWVKTGINPDCNTVVNLDNTPCNGGDRVQLMGQILGVEVTSIEFDIRIPRKKLGLKRPYYVFAPWAARKGPRSLPMASVVEILKRSPVPLALTDSVRAEYEVGPNVVNCTGLGMLDLISLISESAGVIGADTGVPWLATAALKKTVLIFGSHVPAKDRTQTCRNILWISSPASCAKNCGDHCGTMPECRFKDHVPLCTSFYTPEFMRFQMREFERLTA